MHVIILVEVCASLRLFSR